MKIALLLVIYFLSISAWSQKNPSKNTKCNAASILSEENISPQTIQAWLKNAGSSVKSVRDFVCCLPDGFRKNYIIAHSSVSAQTGTALSPRVLMYNKKNDNTDTRLIMSFNGNHPSVTRGKNVEMAFLNPNSNELEFYDLDFEGKQQRILSERNPDTCMLCHGSEGKVPIGGPKYIFDPLFNWPRFVGNFSTCSSDENKLQHIFEDKAIASIKNTAQYDCLDRGVLKKEKNGYERLQSNLTSFDDALGPHQDIQNDRWLQSLPKYYIYKYILYGEMFCSNHSHESENSILDLKEWMPPSIIKKNIENLMIDGRLKKPGPFSDIFRQVVTKEKNDIQDIHRKQNLMAKNPNLYFDKQMLNSFSPLDCSKDIKKDFPAKEFSEINPLLLLEADTTLKSILSTSAAPSPVTRFFLEGEGYDIFMLQRTQNPQEFGTGKIDYKKAEKLIEWGRFPFNNLFTKIDNCDICINENCFCVRDSKGLAYRLKAPREKLCQELKAASMRSFLKSIADKSYSTKARGEQ